MYKLKFLLCNIIFIIVLADNSFGALFSSLNFHDPYFSNYDFPGRTVTITSSLSYTEVKDIFQHKRDKNMYDLLRNGYNIVASLEAPPHPFSADFWRERSQESRIWNFLPVDLFSWRY